MSEVKLLEQEQIQESWTITDIIDKACPPNWNELFEYARPELEDLDDTLRDKSYFPRKKDLFKAFGLTHIKNIKVVLLGQDPYHSIQPDGDPTAMGLSFSVRRKHIFVPSSLKNIYKELVNEYPDYKTPTHGDLSYWALQGVMLLNTCLTVSPGLAGSHKEIWDGFVIKTLELISKYNPNCCYVLWGAKAQKLSKYLPAKAKIFTSVHPSGLSANRGFFGCNHFKLVNEYLTEMSIQPIDWQII